MKRLILLITIIGIFLISGCANMMPTITQVGSTSKEVTSTAINPSGTIPQEKAAEKTENQNTVTYPMKTEENLTFIDYPNLNSENNQTVRMPLKEGWTATKLTWKKPKDFEYNDNKNKSIIESYIYDIYNEKIEQIGGFSLIGRYEDRDSTTFPNHLRFSNVLYNGPTKFGNGKIYLFGLDLPRSEATEKRDSFEECYAVIPVKNENLAYNLFLKVPETGNVRDTLEIMKDMLVTSEDIEAQVGELFKGDKTTDENTTKILKLIPFINWSKYAKKNLAVFEETMSWLGELKISNEDMLVDILNATNGLDGAYTDAYCSVVKKQFLRNKDMFVKAWSGIDDEQLKVISSFIHYDCRPDEAIQVEAYFKKIANGTSGNADRAKLFLENFKY